MLKVNSIGEITSDRSGLAYLTLDITAPLYWWTDFNYNLRFNYSDKFDMGSRIPNKPFEPSDFSCEYLLDDDIVVNSRYHHCNYDPTINFATSSKAILLSLCDVLNYYQAKALETKDFVYSWQIMQLIPYSYNQTHAVPFKRSSLLSAYKYGKNYTSGSWFNFYNAIDASTICQFFMEGI